MPHPIDRDSMIRRTEETRNEGTLAEMRITGQLLTILQSNGEQDSLRAVPLSEREPSSARGCYLLFSICFLLFQSGGPVKTSVTLAYADLPKQCGALRHFLVNISRQQFENPRVARIKFSRSFAVPRALVFCCLGAKPTFRTHNVANTPKLSLELRSPL